jgi:hypothetical protein
VRESESIRRGEEKISLFVFFNDTRVSRRFVICRWIRLGRWISAHPKIQARSRNVKRETSRVGEFVDLEKVRRSY